MAAIAAETARSARASGDVLSGTLLAFGSVALFVGTLFYARLTPELGLPALPAGRTQALADALRLGRKPWPSPEVSPSSAIACCWRPASRWLQDTGARAISTPWVGVDGGQRGARHGVRFDDGGALLAAGARRRFPRLFVAIKSWFDFLFAAGNVPYGLGFIAVLCADIGRSDPMLPRLVSTIGIAIGAAAAISGFGATIDILHLPLVVGLSVTFGCVILMPSGSRSRGPIRPACYDPAGGRRSRS